MGKLNGQGKNATLDEGILNELRKDGRASISHIAAVLGAPRNTVAQHLQEILKDGRIRIRAAVNPALTGQKVLLHGLIGTASAAALIANEISRRDEVVWSSLISGNHAIAFESRHTSCKARDELLNEIRRLKGVRFIKTTEYAEVLRGFFAPDTDLNFHPDEIDLQLMRLLQIDGRASYASLGKQVHLSPTSVRTRVHKMLKSDVLRIDTLKPAAIGGSRFSMGIGISACGDMANLQRKLLEINSLEFLARSQGNYDYICTATGQSAGEVLSALEQIRSLDEVSILESWTHLQLVKEEYSQLV